jgi:hypothetical protein
VPVDGRSRRHRTRRHHHGAPRLIQRPRKARTKGGTHVHRYRYAGRRLADRFDHPLPAQGITPLGAIDRCCSGTAFRYAFVRVRESVAPKSAVRLRHLRRQARPAARPATKDADRLDQRITDDAGLADRRPRGAPVSDHAATITTRHAITLAAREDGLSGGGCRVSGDVLRPRHLARVDRSPLDGDGSDVGPAARSTNRYLWRRTSRNVERSTTVGTFILAVVVDSHGSPFSLERGGPVRVALRNGIRTLRPCERKTRRTAGLVREALTITDRPSAKVPGRHEGPPRAKRRAHMYGIAAARPSACASMRDAFEQLGNSRPSERIVERGEVITAAGVPSGVDMALRLGHVIGCRRRRAGRTSREPQ